jgi:hypothetical protein
VVFKENLEPNCGWVVYCIDHNLDRVEIHAQDARSFLFS